MAYHKDRIIYAERLKLLSADYLLLCLDTIWSYPKDEDYNDYQTY